MRLPTALLLFALPIAALGSTSEASALIGGSPVPSVNMTQGLITNSALESETSATNLDSPPGTTLGHAVAYNSLDTAFISDGLICAGDSLAAFSYDLSTTQEFLTGTVHEAIRFPTPSGIAMLAGDPQIVAVDSGTYWTVYVSNLAISNTQWQSAEPNENNCVSTEPNPDEVCVLAAKIPKNNTAASLLPNEGWCAGGDAPFDGTALATDGTNIYAATHFNPGTFPGQVFAFVNGNQSRPFPNQNIAGHASFAKGQYGSTPIVVAPDTNGNFWVSGWYNGNWTEPRELDAPGYSNFTEVHLAGQPFPLREIGTGYDTVVYGSGLQLLWVFYSVTQSSGLVSVVGAQCVFLASLPSLSCNPAVDISPSGFNAYLPAAAVNLKTEEVWLSYWSDNSAPSGTLQMEAADITTEEVVTTYPLTGVTETPCAEPTMENDGFEDSYWADYDALIISNYNSGTPALLRYLTDSTAGTCNGAGSPQHVSVAFGDGAL